MPLHQTVLSSELLSCHDFYSRQAAPETPALSPDSGNEPAYQFVISNRVTGWEYGEIYKKSIKKPTGRLYSPSSL